MNLNLKANTIKLRQRLESETDLVLRRNIATVIRHIEGEIANDVDLVMSTLVAEPVFHSFFATLAGPGTGVVPAVKSRDNYVIISGGREIRAMYDMACARRLVWTQFDQDYVVVDKHCIVIEGLMHCPVPGAALAQAGRSVDDEQALYLGIGRMLVMWPFDTESGKLLGEDMFIDPSFFDGAETRKVELDAFLPGFAETVELP